MESAQSLLLVFTNFIMTHNPSVCFDRENPIDKHIINNCMSYRHTETNYKLIKKYYLYKMSEVKKYYYIRCLRYKWIIYDGIIIFYHCVIIEFDKCRLWIKSDKCLVTNITELIRHLAVLLNSYFGYVASFLLNTIDT